MIVSINQPAYLPWLGYFERIAKSDLHLVLDHVQFEKNSFTNRNKVKTAQGATWLSVPVRTKGRFGALDIRTLEIDNATNWRGKHWNTLAQSYRRAPHFDEHAPFFEALYQREWTLLNELLAESTGYLLRAFGIATPLRLSSEMAPAETKDRLVLELCRKAGASGYLSGALGRDYLDESLFAAAGIRVAYQDYQHPQYPQLHGAFVSHLSALDLLFNCGRSSLQVILPK